MLKDFFCNRCSLQFGKKYVFDLHLSLVHGEKIEVKQETVICEENIQESQMSDKELSNHKGKKPFECKIYTADQLEWTHSFSS